MIFVRYMYQINVQFKLFYFSLFFNVLQMNKLPYVYLFLLISTNKSEIVKSRHIALMIC